MSIMIKKYLIQPVPTQKLNMPYYANILSAGILNNELVLFVAQSTDDVRMESREINILCSILVEPVNQNYYGKFINTIFCKKSIINNVSYNEDIAIHVFDGSR